jgi:SecD/SecF fusion protein
MSGPTHLRSIFASRLRLIAGAALACCIAWTIARGQEAPPADGPKPPAAVDKPAETPPSAAPAKPADPAAGPAANPPTIQAAPTADKPAADKPAADKPAADKPAADKPAADKPAADKPAAVKPVAEKPTTDKPAEAPTTGAPPKSPESKPANDTKTSDTKPADGKTAAPAAPEKPATGKPATKFKLPSGISDVSALSIERRFRIVDQIRNEDSTISPREYEEARSADPELTPDKDFEQLDVDQSKSLTEAEFSAGFTNWWWITGIVVLTFVVPFALGSWICSSIRLPEFSMTTGLVLFATIASFVVVAMGQIKLGIDLKGGVILIYGVDEAKTKANTDISSRSGDYMERLVGALNLRVNPGGQKEVVIRKFGENQVEIIVPEAEPAEIEAIKKNVRTAGFLEFRITASERNLKNSITSNMQQVLETAKLPTSPLEVTVDVLDENGKNRSIVVAKWFPVDSEKVNLAREENAKGALITRKNTEGQDEVLMLLRSPYDDREFKVSGGELYSASQGYDQQGQICVNFSMTTRGGTELGTLTERFKPEDNGEFKHRLGILFDGKLISAPYLNTIISDNGTITGNYTKQEVSFMVNVLNAGSLPAVLDETPKSQYEIGATVGEDTIRKGAMAMAVSTSLVLVFMAAFYRFSGFVACGALLLNVLMTLAVIILVKAALTLPGLAGLALGVGMAVDANVLIFERMREELARGSSLRVAIRNGFDKASVTIIDSNLTTVITAVVLYWIGTDQVKGFAVTLIIGIVANLFTAITCSRLVFDIADRKRWIKKLTMSRLIEGTNFDFLGKQRILIAGSIIVIAIGFFAAYMRGVTLFGIDFAGGTSVNLVFKQPTEIDDVRQKLTDNNIPDPTVSSIQIKGQEGRQFKVDTSLGNDSSLREEFEARDGDKDGALTEKEYVGDRKGRLETFAKMRFAELDLNKDQKLSNPDTLPADVAAGDDAYGEFEISQEDVKHYYLEGIFGDELQRNTLTFDEPKAIDGTAPQAGFTPRTDLPSGKLLAAADGELVRLALQDKDKPAAEAPSTPPRATTPAAPLTPEKPADAKKPADAGAVKPAATADFKTRSTLKFADAVAYGEVRDALLNLIKDGGTEIQLRVSNPDGSGSPEASQSWIVDTSATPAATKQLLSQYQAKVASEPMIPAASKIGPQVAGKSKFSAILAILISFAAIIVYVWVRFQKVVYGLAGVVALLHDVAITLGFIALSSYFAESLPGLAAILQIDPFKIDLNVVAAFLTIIGFSINDTIVIFDRLRELKGKTPYLTAKLINDSVNQMLGRTLLTSLTVLLVVVILYFFGGETIHGFAFAMLVGLVSGVYSTVFIATPIVLWMSKQPQSAPATTSRAPVRV